MSFSFAFSFFFFFNSLYFSSSSRTVCDHFLYYSFLGVGLKAKVRLEPSTQVVNVALRGNFMCIRRRTNQDVEIGVEKMSEADCFFAVAYKFDVKRSVEEFIDENNN